MPGRAWLILTVLLLPMVSHAQCPGVTTQQTPFAKETLTISTTVRPLTASVYKPSGTTPSMAIVSVEGGDIRYYVVGTPTATDGHPILGTPAQTFPICGIDSIAGFKAIRQSSDALLFVTYYKNRTP
jgi:hypothetical protein